ncbi:dynein light chain Tctex-type 4 [Protopterus annectens]|uniref:dynein light chain Tctex-type 4 n=1 Tax=Protopterus annectens TaxID=7888 RepID=UPI001CFC2F2A|nr:dynein light chain Tctex-type 4 [Protopterus annectens]
MASKPLPLSQETLAQFNQNQAEESSVPRPRAGSISTRRSSQSVDLSLKPLLPLKNTESRPSELSRKNSITNNPNVSFTRRASIAAGMGRRLSIGPWMNYGRVSFTGLPLYQPAKEPQFENTYKMKPDKGCRFDADKVQKSLEAALAVHLADTKYNPATTGQMAQSLSDILRRKVKDLIPPRYKLVCSVILGQINNQGMRIASRCLWDPENDSFASAIFSNTSIFAVVTVHGLYCE